MNKSILMAGLMLSISAFSAQKQFPELNKIYRPKVDRGFDQYKSNSLRGTKKMVLTFDDGPHATRTPRVLDLLKKYDVKATFFILTKNVNKRTLPIVERILKEGHILASHDHDHGNNNNESRAHFHSDLKKSVKMIKDIENDLGIIQNESYYRFPYGAYGSNEAYHHFNVMKDVSDELFGENCINFAFWDIDSEDWVAKLTPENIASNIQAHIVGGTAYKHKTVRTFFGNTKHKVEKYKIRSPRGGGVVLMHDIHERSIKATELLLKWAQRERVKVVPLNEVEEYKYHGRDCRLN
ncbi:polysaccharide deacetylase family protein [Halobacteriovorax sp. GB3]|uniref:polysaccharide deacetylase family protein n=1 Tax=Halobacteriovorax sp. GB3 TaxID=2719615 RepID=UPI00235F363C|nr:polysaccharide deacetylase family protein [Halobacteriovorax sp. GB3]MDD0851981.1 polysaccharide deacetylase family protein [Halobacteriovorax sp. GB3]